MNILNNVSKIYYSDFLFKYNIIVWYKLFTLDKNFYDYFLTTILRNRNILYTNLKPLFHEILLNNILAIKEYKSRLSVLKFLEPYNTNKNYIIIITNLMLLKNFTTFINIINFLHNLNTNKDYNPTIINIINIITSTDSENNKLDKIKFIEPLNINKDYSWAILYAKNRNYLDIINFLQSKSII